MDPKKDTTNSNIHDVDSSNDQYVYRSIGEIIIPYFRKLWNVRKLFLQINISVVVVAVVYQLLFVKPFFSSSITILPDYGAKSSGSLGGLAALTGISLDVGSPMGIYKDILNSETVYEGVINVRYWSTRYSDSVSLVEIFNMKKDENIDPIMQDRDLFSKIYKAISGLTIVERDENTNIMKVTVTMPEAKLSSDVVNNLVKSLDNYVRTKRISNAVLQRKYLERRVSEIKDSMTVAENALRTFQQDNRITSQSPDLTMEQSRLILKVQILQGVYGELTRQFELAKLDEIRDAPIINVEEWAKEPVRKAGPSRLKNVFIISFVSLLLTFLYFVFFDDIAANVKKLIKSVTDHEFVARAK